MDPILETIIWGVVWFFGGSIVSVLIYFAVVGIALFIAATSDTEWPVAVAIPLGWIMVVIWEIFVVIQVILHLVRLIQLMTGA